MTDDVPVLWFRILSLIPKNISHWVESKLDEKFLRNLEDLPGINFLQKKRRHFLLEILGLS